MVWQWSGVGVVAGSRWYAVGSQMGVVCEAVVWLSRVRQ